MLSKSSKVLNILNDLDENYGMANPLDSITKLHELVVRCQGGFLPAESDMIGWVIGITVYDTHQGVKRAEWLFGMLSDLFVGRAVPPERYGKTSLLGGSGQRGYADVLLCKLDLLKYIMEVWAGGRFGEVIHEWNGFIFDVAAFRGKVGRTSGSSRPAMPWRAGLAPGAEALLAFIEACIYGVEWDDFLMVHGRKSMKELVGEEPMKETLDEIIALQEGAQKQLEQSREDDPDDAESRVPDIDDDLLADDTVQDVLKKGDANTQRVVDKYQKQSRAMVASYVCLISETKTDEQILECLRTSAAGQMTANRPQSSVLLFYSQADAGEANAQPKLRMPSLRREHYTRFAELRAQRSDPDKGTDGREDVFIVNDCGKDGNKSFLMAGVPPQLTKKNRRLSVLLDDGQNLAQMQVLHVACAPGPAWPKKDRLHEPNRTTKYQYLGPLKPADLEGDDVWRMSVKDKFAVYGTDGARIPVGGRPGQLRCAYIV